MWGIKWNMSVSYIVQALLNQVSVQFLIQLLISEAIFLYRKPLKNHAWSIRIFSAAALFGVGWIWAQVIARFIDGQSIWYAVLYPGFAALTYFWILLIYDMSPGETLFSVAGGYAVEHMAFTMSNITLYCVSHFITLNEVGVGYLLVTRYAFYFAVAYLVYRLLVRQNHYKLEFKESERAIVALALVLLLSAVVMSQYYNGAQFAGSPLSAIICPLYGFICCVLVLILVYYVLWVKKIQWEQEAMERLLSMAENQQKSTKEAIDIINIKCHDLKHQIGALASIDDAGQRQSYIDEIREAVSIYDAAYHTGNEALDYVLREKTLISAEHGIKFSAMTDGTLLSFMSSADIYALMSNAIDNAFESVLKEPEEKRIVSLQIKRRGRMVLLHMENWCTEPPEFENGLPETTKQDKRNHGFGVKSIQYIAQKYEGELSMRADRQKFYLDLSFPAALCRS